MENNKCKKQRVNMEKWIDIKKKIPPLGKGILVTDGKTMTITRIEELGDKRRYMDGFGFSGYEWEYDFEYEDITHWMPLCNVPNEDNKRKL